MSKQNVKSIEVEFSRGSFEEWANHYEEQPEADVERMKGAYHRQVADTIKKLYPGASVQVEESYDQLHDTKIRVDCDGNEDDVILRVNDALAKVSEDGSFWEA